MQIPLGYGSLGIDISGTIGPYRELCGIGDTITPHMDIILRLNAHSSYMGRFI